MSENQQAVPTKEEMIKFFVEQIELKELQAKLQTLNADIAEARARELKALSFIGQITNPQMPDTVPHTITQEDLDNNPELAEQGVQVGDEVLIPKNDSHDDEEVVEEKKSRSLKKK